MNYASVSAGARIMGTRQDIRKLMPVGLRADDA